MNTAERSVSYLTLLSVMFAISVDIRLESDYKPHWSLRSSNQGIWRAYFSSLRFLGLGLVLVPSP